MFLAFTTSLCDATLITAMRVVVLAPVLSRNRLPKAFWDRECDMWNGNVRDLKHTIDTIMWLSCEYIEVKKELAPPSTQKCPPDPPSDANPV